MLAYRPGSFANPADALAKAVEAIGGQAATARLLRVSQPSVWRWVKLRKAVPDIHVLAVEAATGIPRHQLRPDLYPERAPATADPVESLEVAR